MSRSDNLTVQHGAFQFVGSEVIPTREAVTHPEIYFDEAEHDAATTGAAVAQCVAKLSAMAHDDPVHLLVLLLSIPDGSGRPLTAERVAIRIMAIGHAQGIRATVDSVKKRRLALAEEFPLLRDFLAPGPGRF